MLSQSTAAGFCLLISCGLLFSLGVPYLPGYLKSCVNALKYVRKRVDAWCFLFRGADMISEGYGTAEGKPFEVPAPDHNHVFVSSKEHISEIHRAPNTVLSMFGATKQMFQPAYTMLGHNWLEERGAEGIGYVRAVGTLFPRQLLNNMPELERIVHKSFEDFAKQHQTVNGDYHVPVYELNKRLLTTLNGFCFFGPELTSNETFMHKIFEYNELVITAAETLRVLPEFMKRFVGPFVGRCASVQECVFGSINDLVQKRLEEKESAKAEDSTRSPPNDMIQWIIDTAPAKLGWTSRRITYEIIAIWFGSVHALSATATYAIFDLCVHPSYVDPLRLEVEGPAFEDFMHSTKGLPLLDSFIKESSRINPIESMSGRRQALKDFTFKDGTHIKKGDWAVVPVKAVFHDDEYFPSASSFQGFRFAPADKIPDGQNTVKQPEGPSRYADISANYHAWGIGGIVCPGRFYAAVATKLIMAHVLKNYDCTLVQRDIKQSFTWRSYVLPRDKVLVKFSKRQHSD